MSRMECIIYGALGGLCPTIAKLASTFSADPGQPLPEYGFWIGVVCFAILGAIIAAGVGSKEIKAAVFAGIAAPGIVTNVVAGHNAANPLPAVTVTEPSAGLRIDPALFGISTAHAQPLVNPPRTVAGAAGLQQVTVTPRIEGGKPRGALQVQAIVQRGGAEVSVPAGALYLDQGAQVLEIPRDAIGLTVGGERMDFSGQTNITLIVKTSTSFGSELVWAFGGERQYQVQSLQVAPAGN